MGRKNAKDDVIAQQKAIIDSLTGSNRTQVIATSTIKVGIKNISSQTVVIPPQVGEPELVLEPGESVNNVAIVSLARWMMLRKSNLYGFALIMRDDAPLGELDVAAPPDKKHELHPDFAKNVVLDPTAFVEEQDENTLRARISAMTSEPSLRRLWRSVDDRVAKLRKEMRADGQDKAKEVAAVRNLPMQYQLVERLVMDRLDEINPIKRDFEIDDKPKRQSAF